MTTLDQTSEPLPPTKEERDMAMLIHVLALVAGFIGPLVLWLIKRNDSQFVDRHGKTCMNMEITFFIAIFLSYLLFFVPFFALGFSNPGFDGGEATMTFIVGMVVFVIVIFVLALCRLIFPIIAAIKASKGEEYRYPIAIPFIK